MRGLPDLARVCWIELRIGSYQGIFRLIKTMLASSKQCLHLLAVPLRRSHPSFLRADAWIAVAMVDLPDAIPDGMELLSKDKTLWWTMKVHAALHSSTSHSWVPLTPPPRSLGAQAANAKKMYSWNTVRKLKMDDDTHSPEESCNLYIKHDLSEDADGSFNHAHVHANALRELFTSSGFSKKVMLQQFGAFFATARDDDDEAIKIIEPSDKMLGSPVLMIVVEEMSVADGSLFKLSSQEKVSSQPLTRPDLLQRFLESHV